VSYVQQHLSEAAQIISRIDVASSERVAEVLAATRERGGRLFFLGVGGSAGNCSHVVNDFRKLAGFEAYAPTDNVPELQPRSLLRQRDREYSIVCGLFIGLGFYNVVYDAGGLDLFACFNGVAAYYALVSIPHQPRRGKHPHLAPVAVASR